MCLYLKCSVKWDTQNTKFKVINQHKNNTCQVWCSHWKRIFTLAPLALLTVFSPLSQKGQVFNQN